MAKRVYLDQNKWIDMAKAHYGRPDGAAFKNSLLICKEGAERGYVSFPLSAVHYMETWNRPDPASRLRLARVMSAISRFHTIGHYVEILPTELDRSVASVFDPAQTWAPVNPFGVGVSHAHGNPELDIDSQVPLSAEDRDIMRSIRGVPVFEFAALAGPPMRGAERLDAERFTAQLSDEYVQEEEALRSHFSEQGIVPANRRAALYGREVKRLWPHIVDCFNRLGLDVSLLLESEDDLFSPLLEGMPTTHILLELRERRHRNSEQRWKRSDFRDLLALVSAVAYCDVVVTEKHWTHLIKSAGLDEAYGTAVLNDLGELPMHVLT